MRKGTEFRPTSFRKIVDASSASHVPCPITLGPYTVVRGRASLTLASSTVSTKVVLIGPHTVSTAGLRDLTISPIVAVYGTGTGVPGTTEDYLTDSLAGTYCSSVAGNTANGNLHGLTLVVNCLSPNTVAEGQIYVGSLNQRINRSRFATWDAVGDALIGRREVRPLSAYRVLSKELKYHCYPVDIVDWSRQIPMVTQSSTLGENIALDSLSQMVVVLPKTTVAVNYSLTFFTQWRINFSDTALSSTATTKPASSMDLWNKIAAVGSDTGGFMETVESGVAALGALRGAYQAGSGVVKTLGMFL